jgi:alpha-L-fucosidase
LNVPPDRRGLINEHDSAALVGFRKLREESFGKNLIDGTNISADSRDNAVVPVKSLTDDEVATYEALANSIYVSFKQPQTVNCIVLQEPIQLGQRVKSFKIMLKTGYNEVKEISGTTIGKKRIITFAAQTIDKIIITVTDSKDMPLISEIGVYNIDGGLVEK